MNDEKYDPIEDKIIRNETIIRKRSGITKYLAFYYIVKRQSF